ncbi:MAG: hypothetical protein ACRDD4_12455 [Culicoidibacterales bacterium]
MTDSRKITELIAHIRKLQGLSEFKHHRIKSEIEKEFPEEIENGIIKVDFWECKTNNQKYKMLIVPKRFLPAILAVAGGKLGRKLIIERISDLKKELNELKGEK